MKELESSKSFVPCKYNDLIEFNLLSKLSKILLIISCELFFNLSLISHK